MAAYSTIARAGFVFANDPAAIAGGPFRADRDRMAPTARNISEVIAWQLANEQCDAIFELIKSSPCTKDVKFCTQIRDASSAVAPLIAEGFARFTPPEFARYLRYAVAELTETQTHLRNGEAKRYFTPEQTLPLADLEAHDEGDEPIAEG